MTLTGDDATNYLANNPNAAYQVVSGNLPANFGASAANAATQPQSTVFGNGILANIASGVTSPFRGLLDAGSSVAQGAGDILNRMTNSGSSNSALDQYKQQGIINDDGSLNYDKLKNSDGTHDFATINKIRDLQTGADPFAGQAIGSYGPVATTQAEHDKYWANPLLGGIQQAAGIMSYATPGGSELGGGLTGALKSGALAGGLTGFSQANQNNLLGGTALGALTGAGTSGAFYGIGKGLQALGGGKGEQLQYLDSSGQPIPNEANPIKTLDNLGVTQNGKPINLGGPGVVDASGSQYNQILEDISKKISDPAQQKEAAQSLLAIIPDNDPLKQSITNTTDMLYGVNDAGNYAYLPGGNASATKLTSGPTPIQEAGTKLKDYANDQELLQYTKNFGGKSGGGRPTVAEGGMQLLKDLRDNNWIDQSTKPADLLAKASEVKSEFGPQVASVADEITAKGGTVDIGNIKGWLADKITNAQLPELKAKYQTILDSLETATPNQNTLQDAIANSGKTNINNARGIDISDPAGQQTMPFNTFNQLKQNAGSLAYEQGGQNAQFWKELYGKMAQTSNEAANNQGFTQWKNINNMYSLAKDATDYATRRLNATNASAGVSGADAIQAAGTLALTGNPVAAAGGYLVKKALTSPTAQNLYTNTVRGAGNILENGLNLPQPIMDAINSQGVQQVGNIANQLAPYAPIAAASAWGPNNSGNNYIANSYLANNPSQNNPFNSGIPSGQQNPGGNVLGTNTQFNGGVPNPMAAGQPPTGFGGGSNPLLGQSQQMIGQQFGGGQSGAGGSAVGNPDRVKQILAMAVLSGKINATQAKYASDVLGLGAGPLQKLPAAQARMIGNWTSAMDQVKNLAGTIHSNQSEFGPLNIGGRISDTLGGIAAQPQREGLKTQINTVNASILSSLSGTAGGAGGSEALRGYVQSMLPSITDTPEVATSKLQAVYNFLDTQRSNLTSAYSQAAYTNVPDSGAATDPNADPYATLY